MRKLLENVMEKRFYNDRKDGSCRLTPTEDQPVCSSGNKLTEQLVKEYLDSIGDNSFYALKYFMAEVLCLVTAILQIVLTDKVKRYRSIVVITRISFQFLQYSSVQPIPPLTFIKYGSNALDQLFQDPVSYFPLTWQIERALPIVANCTIDETYGAGGGKAIYRVRTLRSCLFLYWLYSRPYVSFPTTSSTRSSTSSSGSG